MKTVIAMVGMMAMTVLVTSCVTARQQAGKAPAVTVQQGFLKNNLVITLAPEAVDKGLAPELYLNGDFIGHFDASANKLTFPPGDHSFRIVAPGFKPWERTIHILGDSNTQFLHVQLDKE